MADNDRGSAHCVHIGLIAAVLSIFPMVWQVVVTRSPRGMQDVKIPTMNSSWPMV